MNRAGLGQEVRNSPVVKATDEGAAAFGPTAGRSAVRFGVTARVLAMLTALALAVIGTSVIAISAFSWLKDSFDNVATTQLHTIRLASDLKQRAELLAGMAPSLFAGDLNREALIKYSMTSYSEQLKLDGLLKELGGHSLAGIERAGGAKDAVLRQSRRARDGSVGQRVVARRSRREPAQHRRHLAGFAFDVEYREAVALLATQIALLIAARDGSDFRRLVTSIEGSLQTLKARDDPTIDALTALVEGPDGIVEQQRDLIDLSADIRRKLDDNKILANEFILTTTRISDELGAAMAAEQVQWEANLALRSWLLKIIAASSALLALGAAAYVRYSVMRRLGRIGHAVESATPIADSTLTKGNDDIQASSDLQLLRLHDRAGSGRTHPGARGCRGGQRCQEHVPGDDEPRDTHAPQWHHRHEPPAGETRLDTEQRESSDTTIEAADTLLSIINDILDFSKVEAGVIELERVPVPIEPLRSKSAGIEIVAGKAAEKNWNSHGDSPRTYRRRSLATHCG